MSEFDTRTYQYCLQLVCEQLDVPGCPNLGEALAYVKQRLETERRSPVELARENARLRLALQRASRELNRGLFPECPEYDTYEADHGRE